ncbi:MAG: hypothetical protein ACLVIY_10470 [Anaerobutyricum soehngenii]
MAVGMFVSSITDNQMIAAALSFAVVLFCMLLPNISNVVPGRARYTYHCMRACSYFLSHGFSMMKQRM